MTTAPEVFGYIANLGVWYLYRNTWSSRFPYAKMSICAGLFYAGVAVSCVAAGAVLRAIAVAVLSALWFWLAWSKRPPRKRRKRRLGARVVVRDHRLVVTTA